MLVHICADREEKLLFQQFLYLQKIHREYNFTEVICSDGRGIDTDIYLWAVYNNIATTIVETEWDKKGSAAPEIRDKAIVKYLQKNDEKIIIALSLTTMVNSLIEIGARIILLKQSPFGITPAELTRGV